MRRDDRRVIGFTGTRNGMTPAQRAHVEFLVQGFVCRWGGANLAGLHGDCVGADADFDAVCAKASMDGMARESRPCTFDGMRARTGVREIAPPVPPMQRNRAIVADADVMIACPPNKEPIKKGSGTWATIGFARKANKPLIIVFPDGDVLKERMEDLR